MSGGSSSSDNLISNISNTSKLKQDMSSTSDPELILFVIPGSQFCIKIMAYMNVNEMSYKVQWISKAENELAAPYLVPVLLNLKQNEIVNDSTIILAYLDDQLKKKQLSGNLNANAFPSSCESESESECKDLKNSIYNMEKYMDNYFNCYIKYLNLRDEKGFAASIEVVVNKRIPWFLRTILPCCFSARKIVDATGMTEKYLKDIQANIILDGGDAQVRKSLNGLLVKLSIRLQQTKYGLLTNTKMPSAADFALYGILEHLVGYSGWELPPAWPQALDEQNTIYVRTFFDKMQNMCKVKFDNNNRVDKGVNYLKSIEEQISRNVSLIYKNKRIKDLELEGGEIKNLASFEL